jgi:DNA-directed RNA polymerase sigma subunit (sigma70/sigma32)
VKKRRGTDDPIEPSAGGENIKRYINHDLPFLDLIEGNMVDQGRERLNFQECRFSTYRHGGYGNHRAGVGNQSRTIRLPVHAPTT